MNEAVIGDKLNVSHPHPVPMITGSGTRTVVCAGGGIIGNQVAMEAASEGASVLVVDIDPECQASELASSFSKAGEWEIPSPGEIALLVGEETQIILEILDREVPSELVPCSRGHLMAKLAIALFEKQGERAVPTDRPIDSVVSHLDPEIVSLVDREHAVIVTSHMPAGRLCAERCLQPETCPVTQLSWIFPMDQEVRGSLDGRVDHSIVARTATVAGFGGIEGNDLNRLLSLVEMGSRGTLGICTCCRCHGVINILQIGPA